MPLRFADCQLDLAARRLFRGSREIHLSPKAFELLKLLVESRPRALSKAELLEAVWPGVFVSDGNLAGLINEVRTSLGDPARRPRIVRTVHAFGYAFVANVVEEDSASRARASAKLGTCWFILGRRRIPLADGEHIVGREPDAAVRLDSPKVSRRHARVVVNAGSVVIEDLDSKNGTFVRGDRIASPVGLQPGDKIQIGPFGLVFRGAIESRSTETAT